MAENSTIEWTTHTFNPWVGCTKISPACDHCYAESWAKRTGGAVLWQGERRRTTASNWRQPLKWNAEAERAGRRARVFCASLADVFDNQVPEEWRRDLFDLIRVTPHLDWQLLTKRPQNIVNMLPRDWGAGWRNVWLGTTVSDQVEVDRNIRNLRRAAAYIWFISCEPLLGPINADMSDIDWVIVGGESGPGARPMNIDWVRHLRDQCTAAGTAFFFKQWGEWTHEALAFRSAWAAKDWHEWPAEASHLNMPAAAIRVGKKAAGALLDGREWREMPA